MGTAVTINGTSYTAPVNGDTGYSATLAELLGGLTERLWQVLLFTSADATSIGTNFLVPGATANKSATEVFWTAPVAGVLKNFYVLAAPLPGGSTTIRVRKNQVDTAIEVFAENGGTAPLNDTTDSVTVAAGDLVSVSVVSDYNGDLENLIATLGFKPR